MDDRVRPDHVDADRADPDRPGVPDRWSGRGLEWLEWFGIARLVTSALAVVVVAAGAWFLVRSPTPPTEASLPVAEPSTSAAPATPSTSATPSPPATPEAGSDDAPGEERDLLVHVTGAVRRPGLYTIAAGSRIGDVVEQAGGATAAGRPHELNLALPLVDGMRVAVPVEGEEVDPALRQEVPPSVSVGDGSPPAVIDVNIADVQALDELPGVGPATAAAIVAERERNGPFATVDDLLRVPGIGPAKLERLRGSATT